ncbi:hypothetical protein DL96DRAFT_1560712 [Flagelloscypha sp. PMI_526]|nr:hypothetical protein DL96DRAFT_1560712 [Flagelloscypha sp. PMI_526]
MKFLSEYCPSLQRLCIPSLSFVSTDLRSLNLTHLSLLETSDRFPPDQPERFVPYDVLASLTHCAGLRHLTLAGVYLQYYERSLPSAQLMLPVLNSVTLEKADIQSAIHVLQFLASPLALDVSCSEMGLIHNASTINHEKPILDLVSELVKIMLGHCRSQGSHLFLYDGNVSNRIFEYGFWLEENSHSILNITLTSGSNYGPAERYGALLAPLNPASFTQISLEGMALSIANIPFFLILCGDLDLFTLDSPPGAAAIPFPYLNNIEIFYMDGNDLTRLTIMFWWRYRRGLPPLRLVLAESGGFDSKDMGWVLLPLITNGTFLKEASGDLYQLPDLNFDDIASVDILGSFSDWDDETESDQDADEYDDESDESEESELSDIYGVWLLHPEGPLLEDEDSGDDYVPADSDLD